MVSAMVITSGIIIVVHDARDLAECVIQRSVSMVLVSQTRYTYSYKYLVDPLYSSRRHRDPRPKSKRTRRIFEFDLILEQGYNPYSTAAAVDAMLTNVEHPANSRSWHTRSSRLGVIHTTVSSACDTSAVAKSERGT